MSAKWVLCHRVKTENKKQLHEFHSFYIVATYCFCENYRWYKNDRSSLNRQNKSRNPLSRLKTLSEKNLTRKYTCQV